MTQYPRVRSGTRRNASSRMRSNAAQSSSFRKSLARIGAIQHVIDVTTLDRTGASGHEVSLRPGALAVKTKTPVPFSPPSTVKGNRATTGDDNIYNGRWDFHGQNEGQVFLVATSVTARPWKVSGTAVIEFRTPSLRAREPGQRREWPTPGGGRQPSAAVVPLLAFRGPLGFLRGGRLVLDFLPAFLRQHSPD